MRKCYHKVKGFRLKNKPINTRGILCEFFFRHGDAGAFFTNVSLRTRDTVVNLQYKPVYHAFPEITVSEHSS